MRRLIGLLAFLSMLSIVPAASVLAEQERVELRAPCSGVGTYTLYESASQASDKTGPYCGHLANLANVPHAQAGGCAQSIGESSTWNDCVSGVLVQNLPGGRCIELFTSSHYDGNRVLRIIGPKSGVFYTGFPYNDQASSVLYYPC